MLLIRIFSQLAIAINWVLLSTLFDLKMITIIGAYGIEFTPFLFNSTYSKYIIISRYKKVFTQSPSGRDRIS
jgi:hypothetical protein